MLENLKYATISQIYTKDLIFYDENKKAENVDFCKRNGYTFLPSRDRLHIYKLVENDFIKKELTDDVVCNPYDRIFDISTLNKFKDNNHDEVMFVTAKGKIKGVVHIVDYNNEFMFFEFYKLLYHFEKNLRQLLIKNNQTNETIIEWFYDQSINAKNDYTKNHWSRRYKECVPENQKEKNKAEAKRYNCEQLQTFYLNDLLYNCLFNSYLNLLNETNDIEKISNVRNWVAHTNSIITKNAAKTESPIYNIEGLIKFVSSINTFFDVYENLEEKLKES